MPADSAAARVPPRHLSVASDRAAPRARSIEGRQSQAESGHGEGRDRRVETSFWHRTKVFKLALVIIGLTVLGWVVSRFTDGLRTMTVSRSAISIAEVSRGAMRESIAETGVLEPRTTVFLDTADGGRIDEIYVQEGSWVEAGQPLLRLSNQELQLRLIGVDAQRLEQINRFRDARYGQERAVLEFRQSLVELDHQIQQVRRRVQSNARLHASQLISDEEMEQASSELEFLLEKRQLGEETYQQSKSFQARQLDQLQVDVENMESSYRILKGLIDNLVIKAPIAGQVSNLDAQVGELRPPGSRLGKIDKRDDGFRIRAEVDEYYLDRVEVGQSGTTLPIAGQTFEVHVTRVDPKVAEGRFAVDLDFGARTPEDLRTGQSVGFQLRLDDAIEATLVPRGEYYQDTGGSWIFVLTGKDLAEKRPIRLGRSAANAIEVVEGLEPGEWVVTSSYRSFGDVDRLRID